MQKLLETPEIEWEHKSHLLVSMDPKLIVEFVKGYGEDSFFKKRYTDEIPNPNTVITPSHFKKAKDGLLYFLDADWSARLCVPRTMVNYILKWIHESPMEGAHTGYKRFNARLRELFFWPNLPHNTQVFSETCDICQKIKVDHSRKMGALRPAHIPLRPFATVSLDLITGLLPSGDSNFTTILVIVDKLMKFAIIVPTHNKLDREGFAKIFIERVANIFGLPDRIISDRDKQWATDFWKSVIARYSGVLALSSSHHPQTDGQTEILNATIEQMLQAYVANNRKDWSDWLSVLAFAYNLLIHSSTSHSPNLLLLGYNPRLSSNAITNKLDPSSRPFLPSQKAEEFVAIIEEKQSLARDVLVLAQE